MRNAKKQLMSLITFLTCVSQNKIVRDMFNMDNEGFVVVCVCVCSADIMNHYHNDDGDSNELVNWCFELSQPLGIISGLTETFIKRYIVQWTNKAEIRPEEQSEKTGSYRENL